MLSVKTIVKGLQARGFDVEYKNLNLDSDEKSERIPGLVVWTRDSNVERVIPLGNVLENPEANVFDVVEFLSQYIPTLRLPVDIDYKEYLEESYIMENVKVNFIKRLWQPFLTRESVFPGILEYCYIPIVYRKVYRTVEVRREMLSDYKERDVWSAAVSNTINKSTEFILKPVKELLGSKATSVIQHSPIDLLYSVTNDFGLNGAYQVLNPLLSGLIDKYGVKDFIVYPQSTNNFLIAPFVDGSVKSMLLNIALNDQNRLNLSDFIYILRVDTGFEVVKSIPFERKV